jgi:hypothetical protein
MATGESARYYNERRATIAFDAVRGFIPHCGTCDKYGPELADMEAARDWLNTHWEETGDDIFTTGTIDDVQESQMRDTDVSSDQHAHLSLSTREVSRMIGSSTTKDARAEELAIMVLTAYQLAEVIGIDLDQAIQARAAKTIHKDR